MPVLLDDTPLKLDADDLSLALAAARQLAESRGRVIIEVLADGQVVPDDHLLGADPRPLPRELRFVTADPIELVQQSLRDAAQALQTIDQQHQAAAEHIQTGRLDQAMTPLAAAFETWDTARKVVTDACALLGLDPRSLAIETPTATIAVAAAVQALIARLTEVKRCLSDRDWCGLSDALAYDLPADAARWRTLLSGFADKLPELR